MATEHSFDAPVAPFDREDRRHQPAHPEEAHILPALGTPAAASYLEQSDIGNGMERSESPAAGDPSEALAEEFDICASPLAAGELLAHFSKSNAQRSSQTPAEGEQPHFKTSSMAKAGLDRKQSLVAHEFVDFGDVDDADLPAAEGTQSKQQVQPPETQHPRRSISPIMKPKNKSVSKSMDPEDTEGHYKKRDKDRSKGTTSPGRKAKDSREKDADRRDRRTDDSPSRKIRRYDDADRDSDRKRHSSGDDKDKERRDSERPRAERDVDKYRNKHREDRERDRDHYERDRQREKDDVRREREYKRRDESPLNRSLHYRKNRDTYYRSPTSERRPREYERQAAPADHRRSSPATSTYSQARNTSRTLHESVPEPETGISASSKQQDPISIQRELTEPTWSAHTPRVAPAEVLHRRQSKGYVSESGSLTWADVANGSAMTPPSHRQSLPPTASPQPLQPTGEAARQIQDARTALKDLFKKSAKLCERDAMDRKDREYAAISLGSVKVGMQRRFGYVLDFKVAMVKSWSDLVERRARDMCFRPFVDGPPESNPDRVLIPTPQFRDQLISELEEEARAAAAAVVARLPPPSAPGHPTLHEPYVPEPVRPPLARHAPPPDVHQSRVKFGRQYSDLMQPSPVQPEEALYAHKGGAVDRQHTGQVLHHQYHHEEGPMDHRTVARQPQYQEQYDPSTAHQKPLMSHVYEDDYAPPAGRTLSRGTEPPQSYQQEGLGGRYEYIPQSLAPPPVSRGGMQASGSRGQHGRYMTSRQLEELEPEPSNSDQLQQVIDIHPEEPQRYEPERIESGRRIVAIPSESGGRTPHQRERGSDPETYTRYLSGVVRRVLKEKLKAYAQEGWAYKFCTFRKDLRDAQGIDLDKSTLLSMGFNSLSNFVESRTTDMCKFLWQTGGSVEVQLLDQQQGDSRVSKRKRRTREDKVIDDMRDFLADTMQRGERMFLAQLRPEFEKTYKYNLDVSELGFTKLYQMIRATASDIVEMVTPPGNPAGTELFPAKSRHSRR